MNFSKRFCALVLAAIAFALPGTAAATKYVGEKQLDSILVKYSIVTDGTLGVLDASNILSFTMRFSAGPGRYVSYGSGPGVEYLGFPAGSLLATAGELRPNGILTTFYLGAAAYEPYDFNTLAGFSEYVLPDNQVFLQASFYDPRNGYLSQYGKLISPDLVLANAVAVPEPATWAMLIAGFGVIGGAVRQRKRPAVRFA